MPENPWKYRRSHSVSGGIRKMQNKEIRELEMQWDAEARRLAEGPEVEAIRTIERYNSRLSHGGQPLWTPLLIAATLARTTWLHVHCPGCNTAAAIDLTMIRRPEMTPLTSIAEKLKCQRCHGRAGPPRIVKLSHNHLR